MGDVIDITGRLPNPPNCCDVVWLDGAPYWNRADLPSEPLEICHNCAGKIVLYRRALRREKEAELRSRGQDLPLQE